MCDTLCLPVWTVSTKSTKIVRRWHGTSARTTQNFVHTFPVWDAADSPSLSLLFGFFVPTSSSQFFFCFCDCGSRFSGSIFRFSNQRHTVDSNILITGSRPCVSCALIPSRKLYIYCRKSGSYFVSQKFITNIFVRLFRWTSVSALALIQFDAIFIQIIHVVFGSCSQKCRDHNSLDVLDGEKTLRPELKRLINTCQMSHWLITHSRSADSSTQSVVNFVMDMIMNRNQNCCVSANGLSY